MTLPLITPRTHEHADDQRDIICDLFGVDFSARSITPQRADLAPGAIRAAAARFATFDARSGHDIASTSRILDHGDLGARRMTWEEAFAATADRIKRLITQHTTSSAHRTLCVLGGDHSITWPVLEGVRQSGKAHRIGIIQLDAHHDVRPLTNGPSNGTPFRGIIENGICEGIDITQLGIHPFANGADLHSYCNEHEIHVVPIDELMAEKPQAMATRTLARLSRCDWIHLSIDIDVLDRAFAPGTVGAMPGGATNSVIASLVDLLCRDARVQSMDIVEFDPERDIAEITQRSAVTTLMHAWSGLHLRKRLLRSD